MNPRNKFNIPFQQVADEVNRTNQVQAAKKFGCSRKVIQRILKENPNGPDSAKKGHEASMPPGLDSLRHHFGKEEIERRRVGRIHETVKKFIATTLFKRKWMPDADAKNALGVTSVDFSIVRHDYADLIMEALDENRRKVIIWVHPSCADEARSIINGTET